jgi:hypothetical protein
MEHEDLRDAIDVAVRLLSGIPYFPGEEFARTAIMIGISQFAGSVEGVRWMASQALGHMKTWTGVPELRGIYCAGGWKPVDGRHEACSLPSLSKSEPAYYQLAPVMRKRLPEPPEDPAEEARLQADIVELQKKVERIAFKRSLHAKHKYEPPDWLTDIDPGPKPN